MAKKPAYTVASWPRDDASLGELLNTSEVTALLGTTDDDLERLRDTWKIIAIQSETESGTWLYPARQFDGNTIHPSVEAVVNKLCTRMGPRTIAAVLNTRVTTQGDGTHWDMLHANPEDLMTSWAAALVADYNYMEPEVHG